MEISNETLEAIPNPLGTDSRMQTAEELWQRFCEYVEHVDANPWKMVTRTKRQKQAGDEESREMELTEKLIPRPYTAIGFCLFAGISEWRAFKQTHEKEKEFFAVIRTIEDFIKDNQPPEQ